MRTFIRPRRLRWAAVVLSAQLAVVPEIQSSGARTPTARRPTSKRARVRSTGPRTPRRRLPRQRIRTDLRRARRAPSRQQRLWKTSVRGLRQSSVKTPFGRFTKAAPRQYPHMWSWDSAFIAMGLAHVDPGRANEELHSLLAAQWKNGKIPHIVYNPNAGKKSYFPDAARWRSAKAVKSGQLPEGIDTSGLINPPVHAIAALEVYRAAHSRGGRTRAEARRALAELYPKLVAWHRYLLTERDPERSGLVTILHPWESGMDNSPRWDGPLSRVEVDHARLPGYTRRDLENADPSTRPSDSHYDKFMWLIEKYKRVGYDDGAVQRADGQEPYPFRVKDVFMSAMLVRANESLLQISRIVGAPRAEQARIEGWRRRGIRGLERRWDPKLGGMTDLDLVSGRAIRVRTVANFAGLIAGGLSRQKRRAQLDLFDSKYFAGHPSLATKLPPSTSPMEPSYNPKNYWRGPTWPIVNWIMWRALGESGAAPRAERLRKDALDQIARRGAAEYFDPVSEAPYGSMDGGTPAQSWTQAFAIAALAAEGKAF